MLAAVIGRCVMRIANLGSFFVLAILLSGCTTYSSEPISQVDQAAVSRVEQAAARSGVKVYWVNPPQKPSN